MKPYVNTDVKMPKKMLEALSLYETFCIMSNIDTVTESSAKEWLAKNFNQKISEAFKSEYLY
jgi:hypothetical protein